MIQEQRTTRIEVLQSGLLTDDHALRLGLTAALLARKGLLRLLALEDLEEEVADRIRADYYSSPRFDVGRCLAEVLVAAYDADPELAGRLAGGVIVLGMDVYIVGDPEVRGWIAGFSSLQSAFDVSKHVGRPVQILKRPSHAVDWDLHVAHWRLTAGQTLLIVIGDLERELDDRTVLRLANRQGSPQHLVDSVTRVLRRTGANRVGALVCVAGGFAPVPSLTDDLPQPHHVKPVSDEWNRRRGISPIWIATIVTAATILVALQLRGTQGSLEALREYAGMFFRPEPTATPMPAFTPTPVQEVRELLPAPELASPEDGVRLSGTEVVLAWSWPGRLIEAQVFEVRVARAGRTLASIGRTNQNDLSFAPQQTGWYEWAVVVMSERDSIGARQESEVSEAGSFFWQSD